MNIPIILTIAGSDSGGGAGIQADMKAISATKGYACTVITALTAQNTQEVSGIFPVPVDFIEAQIDAVFADFKIRAVKIGMLANKEVIHAVSRKLRQYRPPLVVLDPVMVATSGDRLLDDDACASLVDELLPLADLITPNLAEAAALFGCDIPKTFEQMQNMVDQSRILSAGSSSQGKAPAFLLKGGHFENDGLSRDLLVMEKQTRVYSATRIITKNTHGTGCTLSAAIASYLAQGFVLEIAVEKAKSYLTLALKQGERLNIGQGRGPVSHFYMLNEEENLKALC